METLRADFAAADETGQRHLLEAVHDCRRFVNYKAGDAALSDADARLVVANRYDYALWSKYNSYLLLDPAVKNVIAAVRKGDLDGLHNALDEVPEAANPRWVTDHRAGESDIPNDSIPLFCVCEGVFRGTNKQGNEGELARALLQAGADPDLCWKPMEGGRQFQLSARTGSPHRTRSRYDIEGPAPGIFMAYPILFGFTQICELLAAAGAQLDLHFAAGLGRLDQMECWVDGVEKLLPDPGLADPYMQSRPCASSAATRWSLDRPCCTPAYTGGAQKPNGCSRTGPTSTPPCSAPTKTPPCCTAWPRIATAQPQVHLP